MIMIMIMMMTCNRAKFNKTNTSRIAFSQVLETTTHSTVAATEVALRMVYLHSSKEEEPSALDKERPSLTENASPTGSEHEYTPALKLKKNDALKPCVGPERGVFFERLSQEMTVFVASDTLNSLLVASSSNITAETLILVSAHAASDWVGLGWMCFDWVKWV